MKEWAKTANCDHVEGKRSNFYGPIENNRLRDNWGNENQALGFALPLIHSALYFFLSLSVYFIIPRTPVRMQGQNLFPDRGQEGFSMFEVGDQNLSP